jgi:hypothetical protein
MSPVTVVAPVLVTDAPASTAIVEMLPSVTDVCVVACTGITWELVAEGEGSLLLHDTKRTADDSIRAVASFVVFIRIWLSREIIVTACKGATHGGGLHYTPLPDTYNIHGFAGSCGVGSATA